jgi:hypothetical protein
MLPNNTAVRLPSSSQKAEHNMTFTIGRALVLIGWLGAAFVAGGCATVQPWQRGRLADPAMLFDADPSSIAYLAHWQEAREGAAGGFGVQSGGCGCK